MGGKGGTPLITEKTPPPSSAPKSASTCPRIPAPWVYPVRRIIRQTDGVMVTGCAVPHVWKEVSPGFRVRLFEPDAGEAELLARLRAEGELRAAARRIQS